MYSSWTEERLTAQEDIFLRISALEYENRALKAEVAAFKSGKRYLKIQEDYRKVLEGYRRKIASLEKEVARAHAETTDAVDLWFDQCDSIVREDQEKIDHLNGRILALKEENWSALRKHDQEMERIREEYQTQLKEKDAVISGLKQELAHAKAVLGRDGSNTGLPTSQTPIGKKKRVPNTRVKGTRKKGGQPGHEKHELKKPSRREINDVVDHKLEAGQLCPECSSDDLKFTGKCDRRYEYDVEIKVVKRLHQFWEYMCMSCGAVIYAPIPPNLHAECQYGFNVQACALSLLNNVNAAINKVPMFLAGLTGGEIQPSEGYVAKVQARAAKQLVDFRSDLIGTIVERSIVYWDDTVVMINQTRGCLRFYGDEKLALYIAHEKKDLAGVLEDGVLGALSEDTNVMHDHNSISYNKNFKFRNIECNIHLERDTQKIYDDTGHEEILELKTLISETIADRNRLVAEGANGFDAQYIENFDKRLTDILDRARILAEANENRYSGPPERALINRVREYRDNYFAWIKDFNLPVTNNLSERALRGVKSKMKISGQFTSVKTADDYALIKSYIETSRRNGLNEMIALTRLCAGNPYTVDEILRSKSP